MKKKKSSFAQNLFWFLPNFWQNMSSSRSRLLAINYICIQQQRPVVRYRKCYTTCNPYKSFMASGQILASTFSNKCVINSTIKSHLFWDIFSIKYTKLARKIWNYIHHSTYLHTHILLWTKCVLFLKKEFSKNISLKICSSTWNELFDKCGYLGVLLQAASFSYQGL